MLDNVRICASTSHSTSHNTVPLPPIHQPHPLHPRPSTRTTTPHPPSPTPTPHPPRPAPSSAHGNLLTARPCAPQTPDPSPRTPSAVRTPTPDPEPFPRPKAPVISCQKARPALPERFCDVLESRGSLLPRGLENGPLVRAEGRMRPRERELYPRAT